MTGNPVPKTLCITQSGFHASQGPLLAFSMLSYALNVSTLIFVPSTRMPNLPFPQGAPPGPPTFLPDGGRRYCDIGRLTPSSVLNVRRGCCGLGVGEYVWPSSGTAHNCYSIDCFPESRKRTGSFILLLPRSTRYVSQILRKMGTPDSFSVRKNCSSILAGIALLATIVTISRMLYRIKREHAQLRASGSRWLEDIVLQMICLDLYAAVRLG